MKILITGNLGYVGATLQWHLRRRFPDATLLGFDAGYFAHCLTGATRVPESCLDRQYFGDVREFPDALLDGVDAVVQLAAISNDPMGKTYEQVTGEINQDSSVMLAERARAAGVSHYVFASSCSVYGFSEGAPRTEDDELNPLTAYARSKIGTEKALVDLADDHFTITALRFATACGMSDRLRLDLVLNDFVAGAIVNRRIDILSDGSPWRPLITTDDMARATEWAIGRPAEAGGEFLAVNVGTASWNYRVRELADAVVDVIPGTEVTVNPDAPPDKRSYRVDFSRFASLAPDHQPAVDLHGAVTALRDGLVRMGFADPDFRQSNLMRLVTLNRHRETERLSESLRWQ